MMRNILINKYQNFKSKNHEFVNLLDWLQDDTYKDKVLKIRELQNIDEIKELKKSLPCVTISGIFSKRESAGLITHSGFICIDIDGKENSHIEDFKLLRDELKNIVNVSYSSLSVSGNGVFCLIPIKKGCSDVVRLRIYSYDTDAYINENAVIFDKYKELDQNIVVEKEYYKQNHKRREKSLKSSFNKVKKVVENLNNEKKDITENYHEWFQIASAFANEFGEDGREMFHLISQNNIKYKNVETNKLFDDCLKNSYGFNIGSFFHLLKIKKKSS